MESVPGSGLQSRFFFGWERNSYFATLLWFGIPAQQLRPNLGAIFSMQHTDATRMFPSGRTLGNAEWRNLSARFGYICLLGLSHSCYSWHEWGHERWILFGHLHKITILMGKLVLIYLLILLQCSLHFHTVSLLNNLCRSPNNQGSWGSHAAYYGWCHGGSGFALKAKGRLSA